MTFFTRKAQLLTFISLKYKFNFGKSPDTVTLGHLGSAVNIKRLKQWKKNIYNLVVPAIYIVEYSYHIYVEAFQHRHI